MERVFAGADEIRRAAEEIRTLRRGTLSVGAMPALSAGFVQRVAAAFLQGRADVNLELRSLELRSVDRLVGPGYIEIYAKMLFEMPVRKRHGVDGNRGDTLGKCSTA